MALRATVVSGKAVSRTRKARGRTSRTRARNCRPVISGMRWSVITRSMS